ncbi:hypothetical protein [Sphingomonas mesophila]|uniref:hypothetical protein n=1 Tax=Sphingomonas mesophila TaxID=2303576 RepID=UPI000E593E41|nr:hypothetical protein [Sphingomonas mesophila]
MIEPPTVGEGERLERERRRRYWRIVGILLGIGMVLGFAFGFAGAHNDVPLGEAAGMLPDWAVLSLLAAAIAAFTYSCWAFIRAIDEVDLADNLWGSTASYYAYAVLFPSWWVLGQAGITGEPDHWLIFFVSLAFGLAVYGYRKWRAR